MTKAVTGSKTAASALAHLAGLVRDVAAGLPETGGVEETRKWGQLAFLPRKPRVGTTVRLDILSDDPPRVGVYVHCQTTLIDTCRSLYGDVLTCEGNRAIILDASRPLPEAELQHVFQLALTYHMAKKAKRAKTF